MAARLNSAGCPGTGLAWPSGWGFQLWPGGKVAGSFGYGPLLGQPVIKPAFPLSGQCAGLISAWRISVCCAAGRGGVTVCS